MAKGWMISSAAKRAIMRGFHIAIGMPVIGYIYSPFERLPNFAPAVRFVFLPMLVISGFWMWNGYLLQRLITKGFLSRCRQFNRSRELLGEKN